MTLNITYQFALLLTFGAAILIRSFFAIKSFKDVGLWILGVGLGFFIAYNTDLFPIYSLEQFILIFSLTSAFGITIFLHKNLLPHIGEHTILILTLIFLYAYVRHGVFFPFESQYLTLGIPILSILIIFLSVLKLKLNSFLKFLFYAWFIVLNVYFIAFYLFSEQLILWDYSKLTFNSPVDAFLIGFTAFSLMANLCFLIMLLPLKGKYQSSQMAMQRWREYASLLIERHSDAQIGTYQAVFILLVLGSILTLNYHYQFVSDIIIIPVYLILAQIVLPKTPDINKIP